MDFLGSFFRILRQIEQRNQKDQSPKFHLSKSNKETITLKLKLLTLALQKVLVTMKVFKLTKFFATPKKLIFQDFSAKLQGNKFI